MVTAKMIASFVFSIITAVSVGSLDLRLQPISATTASQKLAVISRGSLTTKSSRTFNGRFRSSTALRETAFSADILSSSDIFNGSLIALLLAFLASFLQGRRNQNDLVLWEQPVGNLTSSSNEETTRIFDRDAWNEMSRPENYILYNQRVRQKKFSQPKPLQDQSPSFPVERAWVIVGLLALFVPIFSIEIFFALSRQIFCGDGSSLLDQPYWALYLCSPAVTEL
ncbi:hypothetical protein IV203_005708 [Nitzschia inconspicua]|uniref:Uncharacterized protein n=1 Tax=Nitzschia inconspicua TaxID=303405 RepID=A0A9K3KMX8_9STRA|nr:hypothetical protein IV203_005708 [Nitzschia inconspicua]